MPKSTYLSFLTLLIILVRHKVTKSRNAVRNKLSDNDLYDLPGNVIGCGPSKNGYRLCPGSTHLFDEILRLHFSRICITVGTHRNTTYLASVRQMHIREYIMYKGSEKNSRPQPTFLNFYVFLGQIENLSASPRIFLNSE